jgi:methylglutamate dehydrogenase subunit D
VTESLTKSAPPGARPQTALSEHLQRGRRGATQGAASISVSERTGTAIASITAYQRQASALSDKVRSRTGLTLPDTPRLAVAGHLTFLWAAPAQWLALADGETGTAFVDDLAGDLSTLAAITDQTDGRTILRVMGARARDALAKGCLLDLHDKVFKVGDTAITPVALLPVQISRLANVSGAPVFELMVMRSFAVSLWHFVESAGAEFGIDIA